MARSSPTPFHRMSRRAQRRQQLRRRALWAVVSLIILCAFGAGYLWRQMRSKGWAFKEAAHQVTRPQHAQALEVLDRAVTARYRGMTNEAVRLAMDARHLDPEVAGGALFVAEMALRRGALEDSTASAFEALRREEYAGDARLILALNAWMRRGQAGAEAAGRSSTQLLAEAAEAELANNQVRFFAGDLLRAIGQPAEAWANLTGSLHRLFPWDSAAVIAAKLWLALEEAGLAGDSNAALSPGAKEDYFGSAAARTQRMLRTDGDLASAFDALQAVFTPKQAVWIMSDPALAGAALPSVGEAIKFSTNVSGFTTPKQGAEAGAGRPTGRNSNSVPRN